MSMSSSNAERNVPEAGDGIIETRGLRRTFTSRRGSVEAVAGVDLRVVTGEVFGFLGPNGAGKTTTLRMLATRAPSTAGCPATPRPPW